VVYDVYESREEIFNGIEDTDSVTKEEAFKLKHDEEYVKLRCARCLSISVGFGLIRISSECYSTFEAASTSLGESDRWGELEGE